MMVNQVICIVHNTYPWTPVKVVKRIAEIDLTELGMNEPRYPGIYPGPGHKKVSSNGTLGTFQ